MVVFEEGIVPSSPARGLGRTLYRLSIAWCPGETPATWRFRFLQRAQCSHCKRCISYSDSVCLSVCQSVCPSHAGIVSKRRHVARCKLRRATCRRFDTIPACDGRTDRQTDRQTDGQTEGIAVANTALAMPTTQLCVKEQLHTKCIFIG